MAAQPETAAAAENAKRVARCEAAHTFGSVIPEDLAVAPSARGIVDKQCG